MIESPQMQQTGDSPQQANMNNKTFISGLQSVTNSNGFTAESPQDGSGNADQEKDSMNTTTTTPDSVVQNNEDANTRSLKSANQGPITGCKRPRSQTNSSGGRKRRRVGERAKPVSNNKVGQTKQADTQSPAEDDQQTQPKKTSALTNNDIQQQQQKKPQLKQKQFPSPPRKTGSPISDTLHSQVLKCPPKSNSRLSDSSESTQNDSSNTCAACLEPIRERFLLMALGRSWHEDCLKCACCDCRLGEVGSTLYIRSGKILCRRDFLRIFGHHGLCNVCKRSIPPYELVMRANELAYHMDCFACATCQYRFCVGDRFHLTHEEQQRILCLLCYNEELLQNGQSSSSDATNGSSSIVPEETKALSQKQTATHPNIPNEDETGKRTPESPGDSTSEPDQKQVRLEKTEAT